MSRILLVDDDLAFRYAAQRRLEHDGHDVQAFGSTLAAWDHAGQGSTFDLVIADLVFPQGEPSGMALARHARQHHPGLPVIFITAYEDARTFAEADGAPVLRKPIELDAMTAAIADVLAQSRRS